LQGSRRRPQLVGQLCLGEVDIDADADKRPIAPDPLYQDARQLFAVHDDIVDPLDKGGHRETLPQRFHDGDAC
jgi:hypothetical protein